MGVTYIDAGVDQARKDEAVDRIQGLMRRTFDPGVVSRDWGFAGLYDLGRSSRVGRGLRRPTLVACTDGVGTKIKLAQTLRKHDTVGIDCVAMSVNDLVVTGARPLFFLDYIGCGRADRKLVMALARGVIEGCRRSDCALLGGETAEMPGVYPPGEYDLAGFCVGIVDRGAILDGSAVRVGDDVIGLASSGLHSNGYSLARKIVEGRRLSARFGRTTLGSALLEPTKLYAREVRKLLERHPGKKAVRAMANITGGGLVENLPRILPKGCAIELREGAWKVPPIIRQLCDWGKVARDERYRVFNMGVGMAVVTAPRHTAAVMRTLSRAKARPSVIGRVVRGRQDVRVIED